MINATIKRILGYVLANELQRKIEKETKNADTDYSYNVDVYGTDNTGDRGWNNSINGNSPLINAYVQSPVARRLGTIFGTMLIMSYPEYEHKFAIIVEVITYALALMFYIIDLRASRKNKQSWGIEQ